MATLVIEASNSGSLTRNRDYGASPPEDNYLVIHNAIMPPDTWASASPGSVRVGQEYHSDIINWEVYRGGLVFDLSALLEGEIIIAAILSLYGLNDFSDTDFLITLISGADLADTFVDADYGDLLNDTTSFGSLTTAGLVLETYNVITLNAAGLTALRAAQAGGTNKFRLGIRSSRDISSTDPKQNGGDWFEDVKFYGYGTANKKPKLTITYLVGEQAGIIAIKGETQVYVSATGKRYYLQGVEF